MRNLSSIFSIPYLALSTVFLVALSYGGLFGADIFTPFSFYILIGLALVGLSACSMNSKSLERNLLNDSSKYRLLSYIAFAILAYTLTTRLDDIIRLPSLVVGAYVSKVPRDSLYAIRSGLFDGRLEYSYLLAMGSLLIPCDSRRWSIRSLLLSMIVIILVGLFESVTLSRFLAPPLLITGVVGIRVLYLNQNNLIHKKSTALIHLISYFTIIVIALVPIAIRSVQYRQLPLLFNDASTMVGADATLIYNQSKNYGLSKKSENNLHGLDNIDDIHDSNSQNAYILRETICTLFTGPYFEDRFCSKSLHNWLIKTHTNYFSEYNGPVLSTSKYWYLARYNLKITILINWILLLMPFMLTMYFSSVIPRLAQAWLASLPIFVCKLISFFRGDPLHSGIHYIWILFVFILIISISSKSTDSVLSK